MGEAILSFILILTIYILVGYFFSELVSVLIHNKVYYGMRTVILKKFDKHIKIIVGGNMFLVRVNKEDLDTLNVGDKVKVKRKLFNGSDVEIYRKIKKDESFLKILRRVKKGNAYFFKIIDEAGNILVKQVDKDSFHEANEESYIILDKNNNFEIIK